MLSCDEFILREWEEKDAEDLAKIANNKKIADNLRDGFPHPYSIEDAKQYIAAITQNTSAKAFAIIINDSVAGSIGVFFKDDVYRKSAEIGYYLAEEYWGKGLMTKAIDMIVEFAFNNYDIIRIHAEPFAHNIGSRRCLEKAGFKLEGVFRNSIIKNGVVGDSCMYAILKEEK